MAEPEELIGDALRAIVERVRRRWPAVARPAREAPSLAQLAPRLALLTRAVAARPIVLRAAPSPTPPSLLARLFHRASTPGPSAPVPATDGATIWLPATVPDARDASALYRAMALQQTVRLLRGGPLRAQDCTSERQRELLLLLEAVAADAWLAQHLPGTASLLVTLRTRALLARPALTHFAGPAQRLEMLVRKVLVSPLLEPPTALRPLPSAQAARQLARALAMDFDEDDARPALYLDWWTGRFEPPPVAAPGLDLAAAPPATAPRNAGLRRTPKVRPAAPDEDRHDGVGPWNIQLDTPHEHIEDPQGLRRGTDRDELTDPGALADALSDLDGARLVRTPGEAREVLWSDLVLPPHGTETATREDRGISALHYPEWDHRRGNYRRPGARVWCTVAESGDPAWVTRTLTRYHAQLAPLCRRFEQLRARRVLLRRQVDGSEPDLDACIADRADVRAGLPRTQALYLQSRPARRDLAVLLLVDVSASTDAWVAGTRRVIDVEREALLLVSIALDTLGERYAVLSFSGESAGGVRVKTLKDFDETGHGPARLRIAALEPERYTRVGAPLRHASALLARQPVAHRLLMLLSDGRPNDVDDYDGPYGVHDFRQAVLEARVRGIHPFCLTVDREAAGYLRGVFGAGGYALLQQPERLPLVLLDWLRRLLGS